MDVVDKNRKLLYNNNIRVSFDILNHIPYKTLIDLRDKSRNFFQVAIKEHSMLVSHESPISILDESLTYNDYDYALVHLFDEEGEEFEEYFNFFKRSLHAGRKVFLDNSIFELGTSFNEDKYAEYCNSLGEINPENFYHIVPDALGDSAGTISNFNQFTARAVYGNIVGVAQGTTMDEVIECFKFMALHADVVAICFNYKFYGNGPHFWMEGRQRLMSHLQSLGLLDGIKIHLLGCSLPQEFKFYKDANIEIFSNDTSNPVLHGLKGIRYTNTGLISKDSQKIIDFISAPVSQEQKENIL